MIKQDLILRNPLRQLGFETEDILPAGGFGAILAHAGVGKTALLVQLALNSMLRNRKVLHISLHDPVNKVTLWYKELFQHLAGRHEGAQINTLWDSILPHRFIMTFRVESFSVPKLEERLNDLTEQGIFKPEMMIIDGLHFEKDSLPSLRAIKTLAVKNAIRTWFTVHTHRHEKPEPDGLPAFFSQGTDFFDLILELQTKHANVYIKTIRSLLTEPPAAVLFLDPATMLINHHT